MSTALDKQRHVLILEPSASGHHGPTLQWVVAGLLHGGARVTVVTLPEAIEHPSFKAMMDDAGVASALKVVSVASTLAQRAQRHQESGQFVTRELAYWRLFRHWYDIQQCIAQPDVVFLPYTDSCLYAMGLLGSPFRGCPWSGLVMRPAFHYQAVGVIAPKPSLMYAKKWLFFRLLGNRHLRTLLTIDESLHEYVRRKPRYRQKIAFLSEPSEFPVLPSTHEARRQLGLPNGSKVVMVYGAISVRKGVRELIQALQHPDFPEDVNVLIAGKMSVEIHELINSTDVAALVSNGRLIVLDRFIVEKEEPVLFAAANVVWAGYRGHYASSGVLAQAAAAHKPLLVCREGVLGWRTQRHGLGMVVDPADTAQVVKVVSKLCEPNGVNDRDLDANPWRPATFFEASAVVLAAVCGERGQNAHA